MTNQGPNITIKDIRKVESRFDIKFPNPYREFLLKYNGGIIDTDFLELGTVRFFKIANTQLSLESEIYESNSDKCIPIGSNLDDDYLSIRKSDASILINGVDAGVSAEEFFNNYL